MVGLAVYALVKIFVSSRISVSGSNGHTYITFDHLDSFQPCSIDR